MQRGITGRSTLIRSLRYRLLPILGEAVREKSLRFRNLPIFGEAVRDKSLRFRLLLISGEAVRDKPESSNLESLTVHNDDCQAQVVVKTSRPSRCQRHALAASGSTIPGFSPTVFINQSNAGEATKIEL